MVGAGVRRLQLHGLAVARLGAGQIAQPLLRHAEIRPGGGIPGIDLQGLAEGVGGRGEALLPQRRRAGRDVVAAARVEGGDLSHQGVGEGHPPFAVPRERLSRVVEPPQLAVGDGQGRTDLRGTGLAGERGLEVAGGSLSVPSGKGDAAEAEVGRRGGGRERGLERAASLVRTAELQAHLSQTDQGGSLHIIGPLELQSPREAGFRRLEVAERLEQRAQVVGPANVGGREPSGVLEAGSGGGVELVEGVEPAAPAVGLGQLRRAGGQALFRLGEGPALRLDLRADRGLHRRGVRRRNRQELRRLGMDDREEEQPDQQGEEGRPWERRRPRRLFFSLLGIHIQTKKRSKNAGGDAGAPRETPSQGAAIPLPSRSVV